MKKHKTSVAVIGVGWSGLSAALHLLPHTELTLYEASKTAGGRARGVNADQDFGILDNGQHILLGGYRAVRHLLDKIGVDSNEAFHKQPLQWYLADGLRFKTPQLPAPWHLPAALLTARHISAGNKWALMRQMRALQKHPAGDQTVAAWLRRQACSLYLQQHFWQPLVWGALNTPMESASLATLQAVLQDSVWSTPQDAECWLPKQDLNTLFVRPALHYLQQHGAHIQTAVRVPTLRLLGNGQVEVNGRRFDKAVLAVAPYHAAALLPPETPDYIQTAYAQMQYHAITTVYLRYPQAVSLPVPMCGLAAGTVQWFFDRSILGGHPQEVSAVISVSDQTGNLPPEEWIQRAHSDLLRICPGLPEPAAGRAITEKRATPAATPNRTLPDCRWLHQHNIYPAGDYLHPRYPATLEAAVQSGLSAAQLLLNESSR